MHQIYLSKLFLFLFLLSGKEIIPPNCIAVIVLF
uniref:Uncharacterized protein n=1 Tax=Anguilla anguilla TaxID=7936 RepID=A0A0E9RBH7_ANGAN